MPGNSKKGCSSCKTGGSFLGGMKKQLGALRNKVGSGKSKKTKGGGSDYLMIGHSRGPANTPDGGWSNSLSNFRQFTKTAEYIPNSKLVEAAAPIFSGIAKDMSVPPTGHAYDPYASTLGSLTGGKRKKKTTTKKKKVVKKKTTTKKKKVVKKKTTKPKRKTTKKKTTTKKRKVVKRKTTKPKRKTTTKKRTTTTRRKKKTTKKKSLLNRVRSALSL